MSIDAKSHATSPLTFGLPRGRSAVISLALLVMFIWFGSQRADTGPAHGASLNGSASLGPHDPATTFRIGTFNIHGGKGPDRLVDLSRIAAALRGADLVGLNEVHGRWLWESADQAEQLGDRLDARWLFAPGEQRWWHHGFGNGVLSKLDVTSWHRLPLPRLHSKSYRNMLLLAAQLGGRRTHVLITHVDRRSSVERQAQLRAVSELFLSLQPPAILLGDLNASRDDATLRALLDTPGVVDPLASLDPRRIDWILLRGLRGIDGGQIDSGGSDHPYYWVDVRVVE